jgi:hypothetical protein
VITTKDKRVRVLAIAALLLVPACGATGDRAAKLAPTAFNADTAMSYVRTQLAFGPRVPGSPASRKAGDWIVAQLRKTADTVMEQNWEQAQTTRMGGRKIPMRNVLARFKPGTGEHVLYITHWDTRPVSDMEQDAGKQQEPIPGANDGASGVALLLAVADVLKKTPPAVGVDLLFVDGEDWGVWGPPDVDVLFGSSYFAEHLTTFPSPGYKPLYGVLWDMIGDEDLELLQERHSIESAPEVVQRVWEQARRFGYESYFSQRTTGPITDDHVPLIKAGLRVIDVIDLTFDCHHKLCDTVDKVSAKSLKIVGDVAVGLVLTP